MGRLGGNLEVGHACAIPPIMHPINHMQYNAGTTPCGRVPRGSTLVVASIVCVLAVSNHTIT